MSGIDEALRSAIAAGRSASGPGIAAWRAGAEYRALAAAFAGCAVEDSAIVADKAEALLADTNWVTALLAPLVAALVEQPFFEPQFRLSRDAQRTGAVLFDCPAASLTANVFTGMLPTETVNFSGRVVVTRYVRGGGATLRRWQAEPITPGLAIAHAAPCTELAPVPLTDGAVHRCDGRTDAQMPVAPGGPIVTLAIASRASTPLLREYRLADRRLARLVSADEQASRSEMLLTFLRLSGRADAADQFRDATADPAFHLRWSAMREWLALDARAALPRLAEMAEADPHGDVRSAAARTLATIRARIPCPA